MNQWTDASLSKKVLFIFGAPARIWPGMGRKLYEHEPVFRNAIWQCSELFNRYNGIDILPHFTQDSSVSHTENDAFITYTTASIQIALYQLYRSKGIVPGAVTGSGIGNVTAAYAAGGLSLEDAIGIISSQNPPSGHDKPQNNPPAAQVFLRTDQVFVAPIYDSNDDKPSSFAGNSERKPLGYYFDSRGITPDAMHPPSNGHTHPGNRPISMDVMLNIGPPANTRSQLLRSTNSVRVLNSMDPSADEIQQLQTVLNAVYASTKGEKLQDSDSASDEAITNYVA